MTGFAAVRRAQRLSVFVRPAWWWAGVLLVSGCGDQCPAFDYAPPSARFRVIDATSGEAVCDPDREVEAEQAPLIPIQELCEWRLPEWLGESPATAVDGVEVTLSLDGGEPQSVRLPVARDGCGEIQGPPVAEVTLAPE